VVDADTVDQIEPTANDGNPGPHCVEEIDADPFNPALISTERVLGSTGPMVRAR
jgi:hypothetical protein